jgi:hypothetical protein
MSYGIAALVGTVECEGMLPRCGIFFERNGISERWIEPKQIVTCAVSCSGCDIGMWLDSEVNFT